MIFNVFKSKLFTLQLIGCTDDLGMLARVVPVSESKVLHPTSFKILSPKQMLQGIPIALAQLQAGNKSENLLNEIYQNIYSLYEAKEITKKVYNNIMNLKNASYKMDNIFMNRENSKTSEPCSLLLNFGDKIVSKRINKYVALSNLSMYYNIISSSME